MHKLCTVCINYAKLSRNYARYAKNMQKLCKNYAKITQKNYAKITCVCVICVISKITHPTLLMIAIRVQRILGYPGII